MIYNIIRSGIFLILFLFQTVSLTGDPASLSEIAGSIESFSGKKISMMLRLRNYDTEMMRIVFYDVNNHDIAFDISDRKKDRLIKKNLINIHEGAYYRVIFDVKSADGDKIIQGRIESFTIEILEKLP